MNYADLIDKLQLYPLMIYGLPVIIAVGIYCLQKEKKENKETKAL